MTKRQRQELQLQASRVAVDVAAAVPSNHQAQRELAEAPAELKQLQRRAQHRVPASSGRRRCREDGTMRACQKLYPWCCEERQWNLWLSPQAVLTHQPGDSFPRDTMTSGLEVSVDPPATVAQLQSTRYTCALDIADAYPDGLTERSVGLVLASPRRPRTKTSRGPRRNCGPADGRARAGRRSRARVTRRDRLRESEAATRCLDSHSRVAISRWCQLLDDLHRARLLEFARADLVAAMDPALVTKSEWSQGGAINHLLVVA